MRWSLLFHALVMPSPIPFGTIQRYGTYFVIPNFYEESFKQKKQPPPKQ